MHNCKRRFGQLQGVRATETLKTSHRPHGRLMFGLLFAGRRCLCQFRHSLDRHLPSVFQSSCLCACSCSRGPIAPMGIPADLPKSHLSIRIHLWFYQGYVRASHACKLHIAPMGDSCLARCLQGGGVVVASGTVSIVNSHVYSNQATFVRPCSCSKSPTPSCGEEILVPKPCTKITTGTSGSLRRGPTSMSLAAMQPSAPGQRPSLA